MSEPENAPVFRMQKIYVKDMSFENPNAPATYLKSAEPKVDFRLSVDNRKVDADLWEVTLSVNATVTDKETTLFIIEVEHAGLFQLKHIPDEHFGRVLGVECPTILFPFTRQIVCQATLDGGFAPLLMEPINFLAMYENGLRAQQQAEKH